MVGSKSTVVKAGQKYPTTPKLNSRGAKSTNTFKGSFKGASNIPNAFAGKGFSLLKQSGTSGKAILGSVATHAHGPQGNDTASISPKSTSLMSKAGKVNGQRH